LVFQTNPQAGERPVKKRFKIMAEEKTLGLKQEGEQPSSGTDQPERKDPEPTPEGLDSEIDETLKGEDINPEVEDLGDGKVVLSKQDLEKLKTERANYKKGLLSIKPKLKAFKKPAPVPQKGEFLTRSEYNKGIEKRAIANACQDSDVNDNWGKVMDYYVPKHGKDTVEGIMADVKRAYNLFRLENPLSPEDVERKATADLAAEKGKPAGKLDSVGKKVRRKSILPKPTPIEEWYGKKED